MRYEGREARRLTSELLLADAMHTQSDVLTSCAVLISLAAVLARAIPVLDPIGGLVIAVFIARTGWEIARERRACCPTGSCSPKTTSAGS